MKKNLHKLISLCFFLSSINIVLGQNCNNNTNTNPNSLFTLPANSTFKQNTFDWMINYFPISSNKLDYNNYYDFTQSKGIKYMANPFFNPAIGSTFEQIAAGTNSDFAPENGWELIKQDFGYLYSNNAWHGTNMNGQNIVSNPIVYFVLYNKYAAKLRIIANTPIQGQISENKVMVNLRFINPDGLKTINENDNLTNLMDYKVNGLFANATPVAKVLDETTTTDNITAITTLPSSKENFFFVDFQLAYDPCICLFKSALEVSFYTQTTANILLDGKLIGTNHSMANINNGSGSSAESDYLAQFVLEGDLGIAKSVSQSYYDIVQLKNDLANPSKGGLGSSISDFKVVLKAASVALLLANPKAKSVLQLKKMIENSSKVIDFYSAVSEKDKTIAPTVITANMKLTGSATSTNLRESYAFRFAVPGSLDANNADEYNNMDNNQTGVKPYYPMFNETPGLFALLETPHIKRQFKGSQCIPSGGSNVCNNQRTFYKLDNSTFKFAFNPIVNESETMIDAAIEVNGRVLSINGYNNIELTNINHLSNEDNFERLRTNFLPLDCIQKLVVMEKSDFSGSLIDFIAGSKLRAENTKAFIILNIYYVFNTDVYGNKHFTVQTIKYPLIVDESDEDLEADPNFAKLRDIPTNASIGPNADISWLGAGSVLLIGNQLHFLNGNKMYYSKGTVTIDGILVNLLGGKITIIAEDGFIISPNAVIKSGFELKIGNIDEYFCEGATPIAQQNSTQLNSYCNNKVYKANLFSQDVIKRQKEAIEKAMKEYQEKQKYNVAFKLSPNPTTANFTISIFNNNEQDYNIALMDVTGKVLFNNSYNGNQTSQHIETNGLAAGIYFVRITCGNTQKTEKLIIQSNY